jgi:uncharacterized protein DUF4345
MNLAAGYLVLGGVVTIAFGIVYLVRSRLMARIVGIELRTAAARADYRSIYGGAQVCIGTFFCIAAGQPTWRTPGLVALGLFALGFGVTRLGSLALDRVRRDVQWLVGTLEIVAGVIALLLLKRF